MLQLIYMTEVVMIEVIDNIENRRLLTVQILYHMPDHPKLLQTYLWQQYDIAPDFPELHHFLDFWQKHLEGKLHSVLVGDVSILTDEELKYYSAGYTLH